MMSFVKCRLGFQLRFFFRSIQAAMRCFFGIKDNSRHLPKPLLGSTAPSRSTTTDTVIFENRLCSLLSKEKGGASLESKTIVATSLNLFLSPPHLLAPQQRTR